MHKFLNAINTIYVEYLGYSFEKFSVTVQNKKLTERVGADILYPEFNDQIDMPKKGMSRADLLNYGRVKTRRLWQTDGNIALSRTRACDSRSSG